MLLCNAAVVVALRMHAVEQAGPPLRSHQALAVVLDSTHAWACLTGFEAESEEEVTVVPGDEVIVHVEVEGWFQVTRVIDQTRGLVPASYVQVV